MCWKNRIREDQPGEFGRLHRRYRCRVHGGTIRALLQKSRQSSIQLPPDIQQQFVPDRQTALAYVLIDQGVSSDASQNIEPFVVSAIEQATLPPGVLMSAAGNTPYNLQIEEALIRDFNLLIIACIGLMLIVKYLLYSRIRFWILPVVLLIFGLFYTFGIMGILGIPANDGALSVSSPSCSGSAYSRPVPPEV